MNADPSRFDPRGPIRTDKKYRDRKPIAELLTRYTVTAKGCHEWTGTRNKQGYGVIGMYIDGQAKGVPAPRLQWMHTRGEIPAGCVIMHVCDNPPCINPDHLTMGTQAANLADMRHKGRHNTAGLKGFGEKMALRYEWSPSDPFRKKA